MMILYLRNDALRIKFTLAMRAQRKTKTLTRVVVEPMIIGLDPRCSTDCATRPDGSSPEELKILCLGK